MNDRWLISSFTASSLIHLALIPAVALIVRSKPIKPSMVPIELVEVPRIEEPKKVEVPPPPALKAKNITASKLLSKPALETKSLPPPASTKEEIKEKGDRTAPGAVAGQQGLGQRRLEPRLQSKRSRRQRRRRRQSFRQRRHGGGRRQRR